MKGYVDGGFVCREGGSEKDRDFSFLLALTHTHHTIIPPGDGHTDY